MSKPSIDWAAVRPEYKWLAQDEDGSLRLFNIRPTLSANVGWTLGFFGKTCNAAVFASAQPGTCNWQDSLVERPAGDAGDRR